jgi:hypothetical protein
MRTVTVEVPEGHMVKIVKEESMQPTQKVMGGGGNLNLKVKHSSPVM